MTALYPVQIIFTVLPNGGKLCQNTCIDLYFILFRILLVWIIRTFNRTKVVQYLNPSLFDNVEGVAVNNSFGTWIKRRRKALDLTQQELAQRMGCSLSTLFKIESDERRPSRQMSELLIRHLEIPSDQQAVFLKVARKEKAADTLGELPVLDEPSVSSASRIPLLLNPLIGREFELAQIATLVEDPKCRLLTLAGAGGIGKTSLALETASQRQAGLEHGGVFINLAPLSGRDQIVTAIADALGIVL